MLQKCKRLHRNTFFTNDFVHSCFPTFHRTFVNMNDAAPQQIRFPAKLLLFGEYTVLLDGQALAVPYPHFYGQWQQGKKIDERLKLFAQFLETNTQQDIDYQQFIKDVQKGLFFDSNIPMGYGVGSSGALCAAVYELYAQQKGKNIADLKAIFAKMEAFFHGKSSGIDPLIAYCQKALWMQTNDWQLLDHFDTISTKKAQFFLLDTGQKRQTSHLVNWFMEQNEKATYRTAMLETLSPLVHSIIQALVQKETANVFSLFHQISDYQWQYFQPMIPSFLQETYQAALNSDWYKLKLCGAGGGGFFLGITTDFERLRKQLNVNLLTVD